jgi:hypothetical protein
MKTEVLLVLLSPLFVQLLVELFDALRPDRAVRQYIEGGSRPLARGPGPYPLRANGGSGLGLTARCGWVRPATGRSSHGRRRQRRRCTDARHPPPGWRRTDPSGRRIFNEE